VQVELCVDARIPRLWVEVEGLWVVVEVWGGE